MSLLIAIAINIISYLLMPKPGAPKSDAASDMEEPTAEAGRELPVIFGTMTIKSPNCLWFGQKSKRTYKVKA